MSRLDRTTIDPQRPVASAVEPPTSVDRIELGPGLRIEQYELIRELGRGGMGQVFLARDTRLGRRVAMKFLTGSTKKFTERFLVEARATARCAHEHIVVIHDVDEYLGIPYMVLEYVEGTSLARLCGEKRLPVARAVELIVPVLEALVVAHEANIVHRDLKPDNILVTFSGTVKVLDFGIAKLFSSPEGAARPRAPSPGNLPLNQTRAGAIVGTLPYMSPEQLGTDEVDHRSDLYAVGIMLFQMLAGTHPLAPLTEGRLFGAAAQLDEPLPSIGSEVPGLPDRLIAIVDKCLAKRKQERYATAAALLAELEPLLPSRAGRDLVADENPYPGLHAFQESDGNRFFGRSQDTAEVVTRLREQPLVGVLGPSGVGKSSLVRAGVVPALKASGDPWEVVVFRPGRHPLAALASTLESLRESRDSDPVVGAEDIATTLRTEPGILGARLRARARRRRTQILLFVDQHEELYTLVTDAVERRAFTAALLGAGDDPSGPLRVLVSMRSDFLDRAAEDRRFVDELTRGLVFLQPPSRTGLEQALTQPLEMAGFSFEAGIVDDMLATLEATPGSLPLLQFAAAKLWDTRDRTRRVLTRASYTAMGGVGGALASHADEILAGLTPPDQLLVRMLFFRLVTPERTRALVPTSELREISVEIDRIIFHLVGARLLVTHARGETDGPAVELVHESLIKSWPALRRWLDENHEDAAFLAELRGAAKQWDGKGRPQGLLWSGEAIDDARAWRSRYRGELPARERDFLEAGIGLATRAARIKRRLVVGTMVFLAALVVAAGAALVWVRDAEQAARTEAKRAQDAEALALAKELTIQRQLDELAATETARVAEAARRRAADEKASTAMLAQQQATRDKDDAKRGELAAVRGQQLAEKQRVAAKQLADKNADDAAKQKLLEQRKAEQRKKINTDLK